MIGDKRGENEIGYYIEIGRGSWIRKPGQTATRYPASGLAYNGSITKEQMEGLDGLIRNYLDGKTSPSHVGHNPANPERRSSLELSEVKPDGNGNEERRTEVDREGSGCGGIARGAALVAGRIEFSARATGREADGVSGEGASIPSTIEPIGEVVGQKEFGLALVQWSDNGLRPIGMKVYAAPQVKQCGNGDESFDRSGPAGAAPETTRSAMGDIDEVERWKKWAEYARAEFKKAAGRDLQDAAAP